MLSSPWTPVATRCTGEMGSLAMTSGLCTRGKNLSPSELISKKWRPVTYPAPPELEDLDLADGGQVVSPIEEPDDAIGNRELGVVRDLRLGVLADEEAHGSPRPGVHGEVVEKGPDGRRVAEDVADRLEAVDDDDRRLLALDAVGDLRERVGGAFGPEHGTNVGEDDLAADEALIEEGELLHVVDELERRLRERREIEALLALTGEVKEHLEREQALARAGLSGDHVDGPDGESAAQEAIERRVAGGHALHARSVRGHGSVSCGGMIPRSRSSGI
jgi:hypothetical protein